MKEEWNRHFTTYIRDLDSKKPVVWAGDLNVAPTAMGESSRWYLHSIIYFQQIWATQSQIGTKQQGTQSLKLKLSLASLTP